jgi:catechol 2,3-dioxygenase-like lactoylglutathione lyase family enzyme
MERVLAIGGVFFRARDPEATGRWYQEHLGITLTPTNYDELPWQQEAGPSGISPFPENTDYFGRPEQMWMLNFRVRNLDAITAQLREVGIPVEVDPQLYPNGRFARLHDPEGNPVELWEPAGRDAPQLGR